MKGDGFNVAWIRFNMSDKKNFCFLSRKKNIETLFPFYNLKNVKC